MISYLSSIEKSQYNKFETIFRSQRRDDITLILANISKTQVIAILDSYDEMIHKESPNIISIKDCIKSAIDNGIIEPDINDIGNLYRELAASVIDTVENELYDLLPEPESEEDYELSKICGEVYYNLEDSLTELFKNSIL